MCLQIRAILHGVSCVVAGFRTFGSPPAEATAIIRRMPAPEDRLVLSYLGDPHYHRPMDSDEERPTCNPKRMRGVIAMRVRAERDGQTPCPNCWPDGT